jgi:glycerol-3-phosphate dehydrogenase (NAD(P)+)
MKVAVLGAGAMGTASAMLLSPRADLEVVLWARSADHAHDIAQHRVNSKNFPGFHLSPSLRITADPEVAVAGAGLCVVAVPTVYLREGLAKFVGVLPPHVPAVSVAKGLEQHSFERPTQIIRQRFGERPVATLCGPSHAEELAQGKPASVVVASDDAALARLVQTTFSNEKFRVYTNDDLVGVEICGALKNVIAIAAGVCDGLGFGDNTKSALLTRGLVEMVRFTRAMGGRAETCYGLAGIGDLITTSFSPYGRNRAVGEQLGQGQSLNAILAHTQAVAEGVWTSRAVRDRAAQMGIEMPITSAICHVLFDGKSAKEAVRELMLREMKSE